MQPALVTPADRALPRRTDNSLVLLAEDDRDLRTLLASALEGEGLRVSIAASGLQLLAAFRIAASHSGPPVLVISDQRMPDLEGLEALEMVRGSGWSTPFVLISAFGDEQLAGRAGRADAIFLRKPFELADLRAIVQRLVRTGRTSAVACAACGGLDDPRPMAEGSDVFFCRDCRGLERGYDLDDPSVDLGGEG